MWIWYLDIFIHLNITHSTCTIFETPKSTFNYFYYLHCYIHIISPAPLCSIHSLPSSTLSIKATVFAVLCNLHCKKKKKSEKLVKLLAAVAAKQKP